MASNSRTHSIEWGGRQADEAAQVDEWLGSEEAMTGDDCACARRLHALLCSARPHVNDSNLKKAAELALKMVHNDPQEKKSTLLAIQIAVAAIENSASAADGEKLVLQATRAAEQWVKAACSASVNRPALASGRMSPP